MKLLVVCVCVGMVAGCSAPSQSISENGDPLYSGCVRLFEGLASRNATGLELAKLEHKPEQVVMDEALDGVRNGLKDPSSAVFRNVRLVPYAKGKLVCGEVNAKNSFGGYVGFRPFAAGGRNSIIWEPQMSAGLKPGSERLTAIYNQLLISACGN